MRGLNEHQLLYRRSEGNSLRPLAFVHSMVATIPVIASMLVFDSQSDFLSSSTSAILILFAIQIALFLCWNAKKIRDARVALFQTLVTLQWITGSVVCISAAFNWELRWTLLGVASCFSIAMFALRHEKHKVLEHISPSSIAAVLSVTSTAYWSWSAMLSVTPDASLAARLKRTPHAPTLMHYELLNESANLTSSLYKSPTNSISDWGYHGTTGPEYWSALTSENTLCSTGQNQSPIDLTKKSALHRLPLQDRYPKIDLKLTKASHTFKALANQNKPFRFSGRSTTMNSIEFHTPSEHTLDGLAAPMEIQIYHVDDASRTNLAIAIQVEKGEKHSELAKIFDLFSGTIDSTPISQFDVNLILPADAQYLVYNGSLTIPPCHENVTWYVATKSIKISEEQLESFRQHFPFNARPTQKAGSGSQDQRSELISH